jgi:hypothetical protein
MVQERLPMLLEEHFRDKRWDFLSFGVAHTVVECRIQLHLVPIYSNRIYKPCHKTLRSMAAHPNAGLPNALKYDETLQNKCKLLSKNIRR